MARAGLALAAFLLPAAVHAELGGPASSIAADGDRMTARVAAVAMGSYMRHDLTRPNGGMVHEFANAAGRVFAISWEGPGKPDLRAVLGPYFAALQTSAGTARAMHALRRPLPVAQPDLQIQTGGHMGWFRGVAFVPSLAPADFAPAELSREP